MERLCQITGVSRASYYRHLSVAAPDEEEMSVRAAIQTIVLAHRRRYGYRRVCQDLRRQGLTVNHKRVLRLMQQDNLLAIRYRKFILTTNSQHEFQVHLNLAARLTVTAVNQLWVADFTYIRLRSEFVYLAVVIDRFSRKVVGWSLDRTMTARLPMAALQQAIEQRQPGPGLVHHSDQGTQYACTDYNELLKANGIIPSMSRPANPYDNAACESFMKTVKQEELYCCEYRDFQELSEHLHEFLESYYNRLRLHSALGYQTPEEFERAAAATPVPPGGNHGAATMKFFTPPPHQQSTIGSPDSKIRLAKT